MQVPIFRKLDKDLFELVICRAFLSARGAMSSVLDVVRRQPLIDPFSDQGKRLKEVHGKLEFKNVQFTYPNREEVKILKNFNVTVNQGETVAMVGHSGCGKF
jgi:ATP-binding cassette subfamily B (MDR/TAP) protein 1